MLPVEDYRISVMDSFISKVVLCSTFAVIVSRMPDPVYDYCVRASLKIEPIQQMIYMRTTTQLQNGRMIAAPEVLQLGQNLIHLIQGKKAIDIG